MKIKCLMFALLLLSPIALVAQKQSAVEVLEHAIKSIEADAAVQMTFDYVVCDNAGAEQYADRGSLKLDGNCYSVLLTPMRLWCDGATQWSYMAANNEVYITAADSDEAQIYNPVYLMGLYKKGYKCSMEAHGGKNVITLTADGDEPSFDRVVITLDAKSMRPLSLRVFMSGQGYTDIAIDSYKPKCVFDKRVYRCPLEDYPDAEIVDMRQ
ncbi:MAG: hypothetical protein IJZ22_05395 [Bacteroidaceae bacterium]|nr:hypothetical protein [Bacteroidaceae bacterium]